MNKKSKIKNKSPDQIAIANIRDAKRAESKELGLRHIGLRKVPIEVAELTELVSLDLGDNYLTELPSFLFTMPNLKHLNVWNNLVEALPLQINNNSNLITLDISNNKLSELSPSISSLVNLEELYINDNQITDLPTEIGQLVSLNILSASSNRLKVLPTQMKLLTKLDSLDLRFNSLPIPIEILTMIDGPKAILASYFGDRRAINEAKVLVIGQGGVGKTSLIRRIIYDIFDDKEGMTEGIVINHLDIPRNHQTSPDIQASIRNNQDHRNEFINSSIRLNIWDFGGQEIMHATHKFFLTRRSLYLLVLDSRLTQEENRAEYWLKLIQSFGGDSPIIIVGNKIDYRSLDIDRKGLRNRYPAIRAILECSAATGKGIYELKENIAYETINLPHVNDQLISSWFIVKNSLSKMKEKYITYDQYTRICVRHGVKDELSQKTLIGFLHDLGTILHFSNDAHLAALGILNPNWVTKGVYKILNSHTLFESKGVLTLPALYDILKGPDYPHDKCIFIVDMMRKFELCYDIEPNQVFLIPDLLPKDEPFTGDWTDSLVFQYQYKVLPSSIISRFIVRINSLIHRTVWRSGVVVKYGENTALVKADYEDRKITIFVNGNTKTRRALLTTIGSHFKTIHDEFANMEIREIILSSEFGNTEFDYKELLLFERDNVTEIDRIINGKSQKVNIIKLLDGVSTEEQRRSQFNYTVGGKILKPVMRSSVIKDILHLVFLQLPENLGTTILVVLGRTPYNDVVGRIIGYAIIIVVTIVIILIANKTITLEILKEIWRFFFPESE